MRFYMRLRCDEPAQKPELEACASGNHALAKVFTDLIPLLRTSRLTEHNVGCHWLQISA